MPRPRLSNSGAEQAGQEEIDIVTMSAGIILPGENSDGSEERVERTRLVWKDGEQFAGSNPAGHHLVLASEEEGGGVSPVDALLLALAGCTAVGVLRIMIKKRQPLAGLEVVVSGDREAEPPQPFRTIGLHFLARGVGIEAGDLEKAIELADRKYCAVSGSLRPQVTITTSFEINPDEGHR